MLRPEGVRDFFTYARRRHEVFLRRQAGDPPPWTADPILQQYRFTNVFRELDRTTIWCRDHVRDRYDNYPAVLPAVVVFRWFNRIETGEAIFHGKSFAFDNPFEAWLHHGDTEILRAAIVAARGEGPYINGAYIIKSPPGMSKLDGVLASCERFRTELPFDHTWAGAAVAMAGGQWGLEAAWNWVRAHDQQGDFTAYEVVTDLRHTYLLRNAPDIMTWANAGPGATRGLNWVQGRPITQSMPKDVLVGEMQELLLQSSRPMYWPPSWGAWEMRDVEHWACEMWKIIRARDYGQAPKQRFSTEDAYRRDQTKLGSILS